MTTALDNPAAHGPPLRGRGRRWPRYQIALLVLLLLLACTGLVLYRLWKARPAYWVDNRQFIQAHSNADLMVMAGELETAIFSGLSASYDPTDPGSARVPAETLVQVPYRRLNAWLEVKLHEWLANQELELPPQIKHFMLAAEGDALVFSFEYETPEIQQVMSLVFDVTFLPDGQASIRRRSVRAGQLPLPFDAIRKHLDKNADVSAQKIEQFVATLDGKTFDPMFPHPGDATMNIRVTGIDIQSESVALKMRSKPRQAAEAGEQSRARR